MQKVISSIRRKLILSITLVVLAALSIFVFAACSDDVSIDTIKQLGYNVIVTYDYQGGVVNSRSERTVLVEPNSKLPAPRAGVGAVGIPYKEGYSFRGFFLAETDADGNVVKDADGNISITDTQWNFDSDRVKSEDITLCAKWWDNYTVVVRYGEDYKLTKEFDLPRNIDGTPNEIFESSIRVSDYTFLSCNLVKDSTDVATDVSKFPYTIPNSAFNGGLTADIWCKSLTGNYVLVRDAKDLTISTVGEETNYYLLNNIDMGGKEYDDQKASTKIPKSYKGKFVGNGYSISNFSISMGVLDRSYDSFGLFRKLEKGAEITDVTFKNISLTYELSDSSVHRYYVGMLAGQCAAGVVIDNVKIDSDEQNGNTFEYLIGLNVENSSLEIADDLLIGSKDNSVAAEGCSVDKVKRISSAAVITEDTEFMLLVKYTEEDNGAITFGEDAIYRFATKSDDGTYSSKAIRKNEFIGENKYAITRADNTVYDVQFTVVSGEISATMIKR